MIATIKEDTKVNGKGHPTQVRIPDMFGSIMSATPVVNPHHFKVKAAADAFIADYLKMEKHEADKNRKADFCICASAMAPHADAEDLRTMVDWLSWIFYFDDDFDEGQLDRDPAAAQQEIRQTLAVLDDGAKIPDREQYPLRYLFRTIWDRVKKLCSQRQPAARGVRASFRSECIAVGCDLAWTHNDIVSYKKDVKSGIEHNFVTVLKKHGFTT
ncbi:pentalenene synthase [Fusarium beomiforme]|uniref:Pentalenene synthase n=1 Tax=Fusarium beomiforme TaxID=44412 RepID=A0A9P5AI70_9HYPO|nr:pentalenene synthase [Fusarium beomiforme]